MGPAHLGGCVRSRGWERERQQARKIAGKRKKKGKGREGKEKGEKISGHSIRHLSFSKGSLARQLHVSVHAIMDACHHACRCTITANMLFSAMLFS